MHVVGFSATVRYSLPQGGRRVAAHLPALDTGKTLRKKISRYHKQHPPPNNLLLVKGNSVILRVKKTYTTVLTARSVPMQTIRKLMPTAKGSKAISETDVNSEVK